MITVLTKDMPESERAKYAIVRRDLMEIVPGLIMDASEATGLCVVRKAGETGDGTAHNFGADGLRIVSARR